MDMSAGRDMTAQIAETHYPLGDVEAGLNLSFTVSIGVSAYRKGDTIASVTELTDNALSLVKESGKGRVFSDKKMATKA